MVIVTPSDFNDEPYNIPQNVDSGDSLTRFIAREQSIILPKILGELFYDEAEDGIDALPIEWKAVVNGYALNSLVFVGDILYQSKIADNIDAPGATVNWIVVVEYSDATAYETGDAVKDGDIVYVALADNTDVPTTDGDTWAESFDYKWRRYRDGEAYNTKYKWKGLKAFLVPYIYAQWSDNDYQKVSGVGTVRLLPENAKPISNKRLVVNAWNDAAFINGVAKCRRNTMYGYLQFNSEAFPNYIYSCIGTMNRLSI